MRLLCFLLMFISVTGFAKDPDAAGRNSLAEGELAVATKNFAEVVRVNPFDSAALNNLAVAYAAQGSYQKALDLLERAVRLSPKRTDIAANLTELRTVMASNGSMPFVQRKPPLVNTYPGQGAVPPEPPAFWK